MYEFHKDKERYFNMQYKTCKAYIIPFIEIDSYDPDRSYVLEIGCGEGGVLKAFTEIGYKCTGIELNEKRVELARKFMADDLINQRIEIIESDIYNIDPDNSFTHKFDIIILKDVIEHIFNQEKFLVHLKSFLAPGGKVFFGFPPWQMPFGGHQQILKNRFLSHFPYIHLLPRFLYKKIMQIAGESPNQIQELLDLKTTGLSIERFERLVTEAGYLIDKKRFYMTNPIYSYKFGIKTRKQIELISAIPHLRNFLTTGVYYTIKLS